MQCRGAWQLDTRLGGRAGGRTAEGGREGDLPHAPSLPSSVRSADKTSSFCASFDFHAPPPAGCAREREKEGGREQRALDSGGLAACSER